MTIEAGKGMGCGVGPVTCLDEVRPGMSFRPDSRRRGQAINRNLSRLMQSRGGIIIRKRPS